MVRGQIHPKTRLAIPCDGLLLDHVEGDFPLRLAQCRAPRVKRQELIEPGGHCERQGLTAPFIECSCHKIRLIPIIPEFWAGKLFSITIDSAILVQAQLDSRSSWSGRTPFG
jgi:hypothetical protein